MIERHGYFALPAVRPCCHVLYEINDKVMRRIQAQFGSSSLVLDCLAYSLFPDYQSEESVFELIPEKHLSHGKWIAEEQLAEIRLSDPKHLEILLRFFKDSKESANRNDSRYPQQITAGLNSTLWKLESGRTTSYLKSSLPESQEGQLLQKLSELLPENFPSSKMETAKPGTFSWNSPVPSLRLQNISPKYHLVALQSWLDIQRELMGHDFSLPNMTPMEVLKQVEHFRKDIVLTQEPDWEELEASMQSLETQSLPIILQHGHLDPSRIYEHESRFHFVGLERAFRGFPGEDLLHPFLSHFPFFNSLIHHLAQTFPELSEESWKELLPSVFQLRILRDLVWLSQLLVLKPEEPRIPIALKCNLNLLAQFQKSPRLDSPSSQLEGFATN